MVMTKSAIFSKQVKQGYSAGLHQYRGSVDDHLQNVLSLIKQINVLLEKDKKALEKVRKCFCLYYKYDLISSRIRFGHIWIRL